MGKSTISMAIFKSKLLVYQRVTHMRTMVLVYLPTKLGDFVRANVGKYSSTMEQYMGKIQEFTQNKIGNHAATMKM